MVTACNNSRLSRCSCSILRLDKSFSWLLNPYCVIASNTSSVATVFRRYSAQLTIILLISGFFRNTCAIVRTPLAPARNNNTLKLLHSACSVIAVGFRSLIFSELLLQPNYGLTLALHGPLGAPSRALFKYNASVQVFFPCVRSRVLSAGKPSPRPSSCSAVLEHARPIVALCPSIASLSNTTTVFVLFNLSSRLGFRSLSFQCFLKLDFGVLLCFQA